jgi:glyoxylase-like metal-dependent hydrolase (beta-lactamase superfamily II)
VKPLGNGLWLADVKHLGNPQVIAAGIIELKEGIAIVDPGPASALPNLLAELDGSSIKVSDIRQVLLTHIHLDHAGATGSLLRLNPRITVFVSERGAPHLADPSRLLASARRLYGDEMERLWGEIVPVPPTSMRPLAGSERLSLGAATLEVAYTPGHASHHVSYLYARAGIAFAGDVAGIRISGYDYVFPPTPPPDINLELWFASLDRVAAWRPARLFLTHFGASGEVEWHLSTMRERLIDWSDWVRASLERESADEVLGREFTAAVAEDVRRHFGEPEAKRFEQAVGVKYCWAGLARYWRKRASTG